MSQTLEKIRPLVLSGDVLISQHGRQELKADDINLEHVIAGIQMGHVVEDYPEYAKGPCVLVLQQDAADRPIHVLWGLRRGTERPAVLITAYRPDPLQWTNDWMRRR